MIWGNSSGILKEANTLEDQPCSHPSSSDILTQNLSQRPTMIIFVKGMNKLNVLSTKINLQL